MTELPSQMTAIEITTPGGPEVLIPCQRPLPVPQPGEVLIQVAAAGVNRPDVAQRQGVYPPPPGASDLPGLEISGTVVKTHDDADSSWLGKQVCALVAGGGYAEYCAAPVELCLPIPAEMTMDAAAGIPETFFTVWTNVFERGRLQAGETLLVHGGSSGIGTTAIQLGKAFGARVYVTAGSDEKCATCRELGADVAINYRTEDFAESVQSLTEGRGVDVILDMVGGAYIVRNLRSLAVEGRLVQIAFLQGSKVELDFRRVLMNRLTITGSTLRPRTVAQKAEIARALQEKVWPLLESGKVRPLIHKIFPLHEANAAHRMMEASTHTGKLILIIGAEA